MPFQYHNLQAAAPGWPLRVAGCRRLDKLCAAVEIDKRDLPLLWDADFFYGPKDADGADTYVVCEINVSSVSPFPDDALVPLAVATRARLAERR